MAKYKITENTIKNAVGTVLNEFFNRDEMETFKSYGLNDPTDENVVNEEELKQKCGEFVQKCEEFSQYLNQFYCYINGADADEENGIEAVSGVRDTIRSRNLFGARDLHDEYLQQDIETLEKSLREVQWSINSAKESAESLL